MYKVLVNDFLNNLQYEKYVGKSYMDVSERCLHYAIKVVMAHEGSRYLAKPIFYTKSTLIKGYSIVNNSNSLFTKYTVYKKEPNGFIYTGETKKICSFMSFKCGQRELIRTVSEMTEQWKNEFGHVLSELTMIVPRFEQTNSEDQKPSLQQL